MDLDFVSIGFHADSLAGHFLHIEVELELVLSVGEEVVEGGVVDLDERGRGGAAACALERHQLLHLGLEAAHLHRHLTLHLLNLVVDVDLLVARPSDGRLKTTAVRFLRRVCGRPARVCIRCPIRKWVAEVCQDERQRRNSHSSGRSTYHRSLSTFIQEKSQRFGWLPS